MSTKIKLAATNRTILGKKVADLRKAEILPGVIFIKGKDSKNISINELEFNTVIKNAGYTQPVELELEGQSILTLIREIDVEPIKQKRLHVTFQAIDINVKVEAAVPIHVETESAPAKRLGQEVLVVEDHIEVEALPDDMPKHIEIDVTKLEQVGDKIHAGDVNLPKGVTLLSDPELLIIIVEEPRVTSQADLEDTAAPESTEVPSEKGAEPTDK